MGVDDKRLKVNQSVHLFIHAVISLDGLEEKTQVVLNFFRLDLVQELLRGDDLER